MKKNRVLIFFILIVSFAGIILYAKYDNFAYRLYERNTIKLSVKLFNITQRSYKEEYKVYSVNKEEIMKNYKSLDEVDTYVDAREIPDEIKNKISNEHTPYLTENNYKVVLVVKSKKNNRQSIWVFNNAELVKKIYPIEDN